MNLSPAATIVLTRAAGHADHRLEFHRKLPTGGRHKMIGALLRDGLIVETQGDYRLGDGALLIEKSTTGLMLTTLALTDAGIRAVSLDPSGTDETPYTGTPTAASDAAVALDAAHSARARRAALRQAAAAVLATWDDRSNRDTDIATALETPMGILRATLITKPGRQAREHGAPRKGTKQQAVLARLSPRGH